MMAPLLVPDVATLARKLTAPPAGLDNLLKRFRQRMVEDETFRAENLYLDALLGDEQALCAARMQLLATAADFARRGPEDNAIEYHTWCVAPHALRAAVYYTWVAQYRAWTSDETTTIADGLLHFCYEHAVSVLRSRVPAADNQSWSLALTCAVVGYVFQHEGPYAERARDLFLFARRRLSSIIGFAPRDGYLGEGSTYQSHVVSPLAMWTVAFLSQLEGPEVLTQPWEPVGATLLDILAMEPKLGSPGLLLPGWDHYGWQPQVNLATIALWATHSGRYEALWPASAVWERTDHYIAWGKDDRMWALLFWPDAPLPTEPPAGLTGWALPKTGATIDDYARRSRLMLVWDACSTSLQGLCRSQVNPNHVTYEIDGTPVFADGIPDTATAFLPVTSEEIAAPLSLNARELLTRQYGSMEQWTVTQQPGLLGAANAVIIDREAGYFPPSARHGLLVQETRDSDRQTITAETANYYHPRYDLIRARRTVSSSPSGLCWIVDDYRAHTTHHFTWQAYLGACGEHEARGVRLGLPGGRCLALGWLPVSRVTTTPAPAFPGSQWSWPHAGSTRLTLETEGTTAHFVVCLAPDTDAVHITACGVRTWRAEWAGGEETFILPEAADRPLALPDPPLESASDFATEPFAPLTADSSVILSYLTAPDAHDWRVITAAMQTLSMRGVVEALPRIHALLADPSQRYQTHSVAAWCLGRAAYAPALADLQACCESPESNTAQRARWAVEQLLNQ